jgi:subtilisin family serine protease
VSEKEYIVSLHRGVDAEQFNQDMVISTGAGSIPNRTVDVSNARPGSYRITHYALTDAEATELKNDSRVVAVEVNPEDRDDLIITHKKIQETVFDKTTSDAGAFVNWGLRRINDATNLYSGNTAPGGYNYTIDGTGVDIVIQDSGIQFAHEEWNDYNGEQRLQRVNWYTESGILGTQPGGFYADYDGHGTHVAGIVAGRIFGWAKGANIYSMKIQGLQGPSDPGFGIPAIGSFDLIKNWHLNKPIEPTTGYRRPTVVNLSWGYSSYFSGVTGGVYRGTPWSGSSRDATKGMIGADDGTGIAYPTRVAAIDVEIQELIDAGVHVCIAAGNTFQKIDVPGGLDYDNYFTSNIYPGQLYYNRGGSPYDDEAYIIGNVDSEIHSGGLEQKAASSETGPGVMYYAPGTNIMSSSSNQNLYTTGAYQFGNSFWKQMNISGSSMASPQVAGMLTLFLQLNPGATPAQAKDFIDRTIKTNQLFDSGLDNDYNNERSLLGGNNKFIFNKFNSSKQIDVRFPDTETYNIIVTPETISEGQSVTIVLNTTNVVNGTNVPFTISGVTSEDIGGQDLTGVFVVNNNTASITLNTVEDILTEGNETLVISLDNGSAIAGVFILDSSTGANAPTYQLYRSEVSVNENETFDITLITNFVDDGTTIPYTITGISSDDINGENLTGVFTISGNRADKTFTITADRSTETTETFTIALDNGASTIDVIINDTSQTPTFSLSADINPVPEGTSVTVSLLTTEKDDGDIINYTITGVSSNDLNFASLNGQFTINSNSASQNFLITPDLTTEGLETMTLSLDNGSDSIDIDISDTSPNRPSGVSRNISIANGYTITGTDSTGSLSGDNLTINLDYGDQLILNINTAGNPLFIKTQPTTGTDNQVLGIPGQGSTSGNIVWTPSYIGTFYYQSSVDDSMGGQIIVS